MKKPRYDTRAGAKADSFIANGVPHSAPHIHKPTRDNFKSENTIFRNLAYTNKISNSKDVQMFAKQLYFCIFA
jgi:hypothetical protein